MTFKELDRPTRLRKAILKMSADDENARLVTPQDVQRVWSQLGESGWCPNSITEVANADDIDEKLFKMFMKCLNSYL